MACSRRPFGSFWVVQGFFVVVLTAFTTTGSIAFSPLGLVASVIGIAIAQFGDFRTFVRRREYEPVTPEDQMTAPYGRVLVLQAVILVGGFAVILLGQAVLLVALLVAFKTILDLYLSVRAHRPTAPEARARASRLDPRSTC